MELPEKISKEEKKIYMPDIKSNSENKIEETENELKELITRKKNCAKCLKEKINCNGLCPICVYKVKKDAKLNTSKKQ